MPCSGEQLDPGAGFEFVKLNQAAFSVRAMCRVLGLSPSGYYAWLDRKPSEREKHDAVLTTQIETIWKENREVYGRPRIFAELKEDGEEVGEKRVGRLMKQAGIVGVSRRRLGPRTTNRNVDARPAPDLVERDFTADGPDQLWVADITYIPAWAGFLYLAVVVDVWSRRVVGWSMASHLRRRDCHARFCGRSRWHRRHDRRHAQDHARTSPPGKESRTRGWRTKPQDGAFRRGAHQGQPRAVGRFPGCNRATGPKPRG